MKHCVKSRFYEVINSPATSMSSRTWR